jgi:hypothetical protein
MPIKKKKIHPHIKSLIDFLFFGAVLAKRSKNNTKFQKNTIYKTVIESFLQSRTA